MNFIRNRSNLHWGGGGDAKAHSNQDRVNNGPSTSKQISPHSTPFMPKTEDPLASAMLGLAEMATKLFIVHPCKVLRRQCQVHQHARSIHLTPVTLMPVIFNMTSKEGILTLWKGSIGNGVLWGLTSVTEIVLSDVCGLPKSFVPGGSTEKFWKHILLKAVSTFVMTPFYISSFIETVRSESGAGADENRVMEVIVKGVDRMRFFAFGARDASRRFSILHLAVPTVAFHTSHYLVKTMLYQYLYNMARRYVNRKPESDRSTFHEFVPLIFAQMTSSVCTDLILFPFETILHRMYIQGTRTLIDNLDTGLSAASITIKYSGFFDCLQQTVKREGFWVLYAGAGALVLEYMLQSMLHQVARACFDRGTLRRATQAHHFTTTPPLSHAANLDTIGPLSGPLAIQQMPPQDYYSSDESAPVIGSPSRAIPISTTAPSVPFSTASPPLLSSPPMPRTPKRDALSFPSFGETSGTFHGAQSTGSFGNPPHQPPKSSIFGRNPSASTTWDTLPPLHLDTNNQFQ
ncbi:unnamed protein product, partial [Mesorhabditis belari]|uniref:Solute carrier family 25 member 46 n=1 Tax=Mesorhabditis belari TaxID=2138241 RepID=A0AAF3EFI1_9BILA